jgi:hypothetical protein
MLCHLYPCVHNLTLIMLPTTRLPLLPTTGDKEDVGVAVPMAPPAAPVAQPPSPMAPVVQLQPPPAEPVMPNAFIPIEQLLAGEASAHPATPHMPRWRSMTRCAHAA